MTRVLLVLNKPNREMVIMNAIKREIMGLAPTAQVKILPYDRHFLREVIAFAPDVVMTFPMTSKTLAEPYYIFKHLFGTKVVCFRAEGIVDPASAQSMSNHVGYDRYGPQLVDYEVFWGPGPAKLIGEALVAARKLSALGRVKFFGYPRLERYFGIPVPEGSVALSESMQAKLRAFGRERTILLATGFHFANYNREMIFAAKDLDAENKCAWLLEMIERVKVFRASWIDGIRRSAAENPDLLFVLKKHPIERRDDYNELNGIANLLHVSEDVDIGDLVERAALFFHYGSTSLADAYLGGLPGIYVYSRDDECRAWFPDLGWPSARSAAVDEIPGVVREFRSGRLVCNAQDPRIKEVLEFNFNIRDGEPYRPSHQIAQFLLQEDKAQRPSPLDMHRWRALSHFYYFKLRRAVVPPIKRALKAALARFQ